MSAQNILILEADIAFAEKLNKSLKDLGYFTILKTDISEPDELLGINLPIHSIICDLELESIEGLTIYSYLKQSKSFKNTTFSFLSDNNDTFSLLENMSLERAVVLNKAAHFKSLLADIINNIPLPTDTYTDKKYITEINGSLSEISLREILLYCSYTKYSGIIALNRENEFAVIKLHFGEIQQIDYKNKDIPTAIEILSTWNSAGFRLERYHYSIEEMRKIANYSRDRQDSNGSGNGRLLVPLNDLFIDIFGFLYLFIQEQIDTAQTSWVFKVALQHFYQQHGYSDLQIHFNPDDDEVVTFNFELKKENSKDFIGLVKEILETAKSFDASIDTEEFIEYTNELRPYLEQIDFYQLLTSVKINSL